MLLQQSLLFEKMAIRLTDDHYLYSVPSGLVIADMVKNGYYSPVRFHCAEYEELQATHAYKLHLDYLLEEYDLANTQLQRIENEVKDVLDRFPYASKILAITGVSATSLAGVLGESGDLSGYAHGNALLRHAGLNLTEASSVKWKGQMTLSKRGRPRLRHFLYLITMCMVMSNQEFKALHHHNVQVKKLKKNEVYHEVMRKVGSTFSSA
jgi:transposase